MVVSLPLSSLARLRSLSRSLSVSFRYVAQLQTAARSYSQFQREAGKPSSQVGDFDTQPAWTLGDLPRLKSLAKAKEEDTLSLTDESFAMKRKIAELQSLMLKGESHLSPLPFSDAC